MYKSKFTVPNLSHEKENRLSFLKVHINEIRKCETQEIKKLMDSGIEGPGDRNRIANKYSMELNPLINEYYDIMGKDKHILLSIHGFDFNVTSYDKGTDESPYNVIHVYPTNDNSKKLIMLSYPNHDSYCFPKKFKSDDEGYKYVEKKLLGLVNEFLSKEIK